MRFTRSFMLLLSALVLAACGDPRDETLPLDLSKAGAEVQASFEQLTASEQQAIARYEIRRAARLAAGDQSAQKPVTYRQAIADEMVYETAKAQQLVAEQVEAQAREKVSGTISEQQAWGKTGLGLLLDD